jgi:hypothetical protein
MKKYYCHVCGYPDLDYAPWGEDGQSPSFDICPCCGVEFGYEDATDIAKKIFRENWISSGAEWFDPKIKPAYWNLKQQLINIDIKL